ncbi:PAS domain S-box protein [Brevibacillus fluminis]|uniref:Sensor histidine kinase n=1 Tax=Brevibacillus fluminis TaxID=511487 RepID=A0A3M8DTF0_9BACL|nr:ATP-binding protein [Brevibacillus fluminis]RNB91438.1 PAS domain S-box protein [Brevibacillus fluminis]
MQQKDYLKQVFDHLQDGIIIFDKERTILAINPSAEKLTGWHLGGAVPYCSFCQTREVPPGEERCYLVAKREVPYFLSSMPTYEGHYIDVEMSTAVMYENEEQHQQEVLLVLKDMTVKKKEEEARISKLLLHKTLEAQENEHKRLAQELHDSVGQSLYSISVGLQAIQAQIDRDEAFKSYMGEIVHELDKVVNDVKLYSLQLRPHSLDQLGLVPTISNLIHNLNKTHAANIRFIQNMDSLRLKPLLEINLYRVTQEALHNALKYSKADEIEVFLSWEDEGLTLAVRDRGVGFSREAIQEGLGLKHMEERVSHMNGQLTIHSILGEGTEIIVTVQEREGFDSDPRSFG